MGRNVQEFEFNCALFPEGNLIKVQSEGPYTANLVGGEGYVENFDIRAYGVTGLYLPEANGSELCAIRKAMTNMEGRQFDISRQCGRCGLKVYGTLKRTA